MSNTHFSNSPHDHGRWHESVLSTRSLSFLSNADAMSSSGAGGIRSRTTSMSLPHPPSHLSIMTDESDLGLEMSGPRKQARLDVQAGLPCSVANSPIFTLPREIRDKIYEYCLATPYSLPVEWPTVWRAHDLQPQLLRTCRIIHREAAPALYMLNHMSFHHPSDANMFVRAIASTELSQHINTLSLHIKAQDTRFWTPYLTSRDAHRSLRADFPHLRKLNIRFRSNKWQHALPPESNLKLWCEDSRLDEIIYGLRQVYIDRSGVDDPMDESGSGRSSATFPGDQNDARTRLENAHLYNPHIARHYAPPTVKVVCACRINATHFAQLTAEETPAPPPSTPAILGGAGVTRSLPGTPPNAPRAVREGDPFIGFTAIDLRNNTKKLSDPELGSASVARTPFANKNGILLSLEIHCLDPKRDNPETRNV